VGANGAGKSNFISALEMLGRIVDEDLALFVGRRGGASALLFAEPKGTSRIRLRLDFESNGYEAVLTPAAGDSLVFESERIWFRSEGADESHDVPLGRGHDRRTADQFGSYSIVTTKRFARGGAHRGGVSSWLQVESEVRRLLNDSSINLLTTLFDYYAFPSDVPGMSDRPVGDARARVEHVEQAIAVAIGDPRFRPHLVLHELEAWVLEAPDALAHCAGDPRVAAASMPPFSRQAAQKKSTTVH
jgi:hypothetical protein